MAQLVLFVDDDVNLLDGIARSLRKEPYAVRTAKDPSTAFDVLRKEPVDVVVADHQMPGMQGAQFLSVVRSGYPNTIRMMLTGNASIEVAMQAINEGQIYRFFTKPVNFMELSQSLRQAFREKEMLDKSRQLLDIVKRQAAVLDQLEDEHPGIANLPRDREGRLVLPSSEKIDREDLLAQMQKEIDRALGNLDATR